VIDRVAATFAGERRRIGVFRLRWCALGSLVFLTAIPFSNASEFSGGIRGTVSDSEGTRIRGAAVVLNNQETDTVFSTRTSCGGTYEVLKLPFGTYSLTVRVSGFRTFTVFGIKLDNATEFTQNIEMLSGKMADNVLLPANNADSGTQTAELSVTDEPGRGQTIDGVVTSVSGNAHATPTDRWAPKSLHAVTPGNGSHSAGSGRRKHSGCKAEKVESHP
jgi:hypothetical protein